MIEGEAGEAEADLPEVVQACGLAGTGFGGNESGKKQGGKNGDDADDDQQLEQTEGVLGLSLHPVRSKAQAVPREDDKGANDKGMKKSQRAAE